MRLHRVIRFAALPIALSAFAPPATAAQDSSTAQDRPTEGQALPGVVYQFRDVVDSSGSTAATAAPTEHGYAEATGAPTPEELSAAFGARGVSTRPVPVRSQDLRSPDARDGAVGRGTHDAPDVTVVRVTEPAPAADGGIDWGDAGIGAATLLGLILLGVAVATMMRHRSSKAAAIS
jgi:hypothetical protein